MASMNPYFAKIFVRHIVVLQASGRRFRQAFCDHWREPLQLASPHLILCLEAM